MKTKKIKLKLYTIKYHEWRDMEGVIQDCFPERKLRDFAGKFGRKQGLALTEEDLKLMNETPYQDFWHYMLDYWGEFQRGKPMSVNWAEMHDYNLEQAREDPSKNWLVEISAKGVEFFGDKDYTVIHDW